MSESFLLALARDTKVELTDKQLKVFTNLYHDQVVFVNYESVTDRARVLIEDGQHFLARC